VGDRRSSQWHLYTSYVSSPWEQPSSVHFIVSHNEKKLRRLLLFDDRHKPFIREDEQQSSGFRETDRPSRLKGARLAIAKGTPAHCFPFRGFFGPLPLSHTNLTRKSKRSKTWQSETPKPSRSESRRYLYGCLGPLIITDSKNPTFEVYINVRPKLTYLNY